MGGKGFSLSARGDRSVTLREDSVSRSRANFRCGLYGLSNKHGFNALRNGRAGLFRTAAMSHANKLFGVLILSFVCYK